MIEVFLNTLYIQRLNQMCQMEELQKVDADLIIPYVAGTKFLLLLDRYPAYRNREFRDAIAADNGTDTFIPGRCTSLPLDLTVNRSFKCNLRTIWKVWKIAHTDD